MSAVDAGHQQLEQLLARAFHQGRAVLANELIDEVRRQVKEETGAAVNYEVPLIGKEHGHLLRTVAPRLALFLEDKRLGPRSRSVFLSFFWRDTLYFVSAPEFYDHVQQALGLDSEAFGEVLGSWQRTGRSSAGLLPAGD